MMWRIVGDRPTAPWCYVLTSPRTRPPLSTTQVRRMEAEAERRRVEREAEVAAHRARHAELLTEHAASPILTALLHAHAPQVKDEWIECDGCASYWDGDEYGTGGETQPQWPCPTWVLIEQGA